MSDELLFYPVWLRTGATPPYQIGKQCDTRKEAQVEIDRIVNERVTPFSAVIEFSRTKGKRLIIQTIKPLEMRLGARHLAGIMDQFDAGVLRE